MVVMVKQGKKTTKYVLASSPADRRVHLDAIKRLLAGTYVSFATPEIRRALAGQRVRDSAAGHFQRRTSADRGRGTAFPQRGALFSTRARTSIAPWRYAPRITRRSPKPRIERISLPMDNRRRQTDRGSHADSQTIVG